MLSLFSRALFFVYLGNIVRTSKQYSESGTMGSDQKIDNKTIPVDMNVDFRIPFSIFVLYVLQYVLCVCVFMGFIKPNTTITLNIFICILIKKNK
jgi:hypothetical protein